MRGPQPTQADSGTLKHGELPLQPASGLSAMLRAQRRRETEGGWADMREELLAKVLELLEAAGRQQGGLGFSQTSATVRLVCAGWKAVHDALVTRLVLRRETTDEAVGMLVRSFPAVVSLEVKGDGWSVLTDEALRAVISLRALTSVNLAPYVAVTDVGAASCEQPDCTRSTSSFAAR